VIITEKGIEFVRKRYSCSVELERGEIKLYEFLMRLLSFGGILSLALIRGWREGAILGKAQKSHCVTVTALRGGLPKKEVEGVIREIWGEIPEGIYV
jgi:hypothetical protein